MSINNLFAEQRTVWAISPKEVGFLRLFYFVMVIWISIFTILYAATTFTGNSLNLLVSPFDNDFSVWRMGPELSFYLLLSTGIIVLSCIVYALVVVIDRPTYSWFELQVFGSKKLKRWDYIILVFGALMFIGKLLWGNSLQWYHIFIFLAVIVTTWLNFFSRAEKDNLIPDISPKPVPQQEGVEPEAATPTENSESRSYAWTSLAGNFHITDFQLSLDEIEKRRKQNQDAPVQKPKDVAARVKDGLSADLHRLAAEIAGKLEKKEARCIARVDTLLQFVHQFNYVSDEDSMGTEYARYPIETLYDEEGDCDCFAILAAALFKLHGHNAALIFLPNHCMAGVGIPENIEVPGKWVAGDDGKKYFICEATGRGWRVGELGSDSGVSSVEAVIPV